jgi:competence protein ComEC
MFENQTPALTALHDAMQQRGLAVGEIYAGDRLKVRDSSHWLVLHPPRRGVVGSDNANSLTLRADYAGRTILLTGDLEPPGMNDLLAGEPIDCDVALAPHHGSTRSGPDDFFAWCRPEWVVISGAANEGEAAVKAASSRDGGRALNTGRSGAVQVTLGAGRFEVRAWRREPW